MLSKSVLQETFSGSTVLISGHTGFKGAWLSFILQQLGAKTIGYSSWEPTDPRHCYYALNVKSRISNEDACVGDVRDINKYMALFDRYEPDFVFHLAAQALVSRSYKNPLETFSTNCMGVANILEILRNARRRTNAVIITSDKCYKNKERIEPYKENEEMGGDDPYSASKGAAELIFNSYYTSFFKNQDIVNIASTRAGNVFGGGDWSDNRLIPDCMRDLLGSGLIEIRMPEAVRPWTFVVDILYGYILLAHHLKFSSSFDGSWNFASGETRTVMDICTTLIDKFQSGAVKIDREKNIGKESGLLLIDPSKARNKLGWRPRFSLDSSLADTAEWYIKQRNGVEMEAFSRSYLDAFFEGIA